jgi:predicted ATPase
VVFVPLEAVRPPQSIGSALAARLGLRDRPGAAGHEAVLAALAGRPRLLLFDGAEDHREDVARLAAELLESAPGLRIMVTSRIVLGLLERGQQRTLRLLSVFAAPFGIADARPCSASANSTRQAPSAVWWTRPGWW